MNVADAIAAGHATKKTIAKATGQSLKATSRAIDALWNDGKITKQVFPSAPPKYAITRTPKEARRALAATDYSHDPPPESPLLTDDNLLRTVQNRGPLTAAAIAKSIGKPTINFIRDLYALRAAGRIVIDGYEGQKPIWTATPTNKHL